MQLLKPPGTIEHKLLSHIYWIKNNLHILNDCSISDEDWKNKRRIIGGDGETGLIWRTKGAHGGGLKKTKKAADMTTEQMVQGMLGVVESL